MNDSVKHQSAETNENRKGLYIDGKSYVGEAVYEIINPATEDTIATICGATVNDVEFALKSAESAYPSWSTSKSTERIKWMTKLKNAVMEGETELRDAVHQEMGKPWASTLGDYSMLVEALDYYINLIRKIELVDESKSKPDYHHSIIKRPIGVVAAFLAWNFPLLNIAYKIGPAMASGCPIIIKPSKVTSLSAAVFGEICEKIGLPKGVINIVSGDDALIGDTISSSKIPAMISLIGSTEVGKHVMRTGATSIKRYSMELGGNAPVIVYPDADLELASGIITDMKTENAGQICVSPNRIFVHSSIISEFKKYLIAKLKTKTVGFDKHAQIDMGPLMHKNALIRIQDMLGDALQQGACIEFGGSTPVNCSTGFYLEPTIVSGVTENMRLFKEEVFGPVVSLVEFSDKHHVIQQANQTDAGLASYVFGQDSKDIAYATENLDFGEVHVNGIAYDINLPHCGIKQSGNGVDCSELALEEYFTVKRISKALSFEG